MVGIEDGAGVIEFDVFVGSVGPGNFKHSVEPGANPVGFHGLVAGSLQAVDLTFDGLGRCRREVLGALGGQLGQLLSVLGQAVAVTLTQFGLNGGQLAAQDGLPLGVLKALGNVPVDVLTNVNFGQRGLGPLGGQNQSLVDIDGLQQRELLLVREIGPVGDRVGQWARLVGLWYGAHGSTAADPVEQSLGHCSILGRQLPGFGAGLGYGHGAQVMVMNRSGLNPEATGSADNAGSDNGSIVSSQGDNGGAVGQLVSILNGCGNADLGELAVGLWHHQHGVWGAGCRSRQARWARQ